MSSQSQKVVVKRPSTAAQEVTAAPAQAPTGDNKSSPTSNRLVPAVPKWQNILNMDARKRKAKELAALKFVIKLPPGELRNRVYYFLFNMTAKDEIDIKESIGNPFFMPKFLKKNGLLFTSRQTRREALPAFVAANTWLIRSWPGNQYFRRWISNVPNGLSNVDKLKFGQFSRFNGREHPINGDIALMLDCQYLKKVTIKLHISNLIYGGYVQDYDVKSVARVVEDFRMAPMLDCRSLRLFVIDYIWSDRIEENTAGDPDAAVTGLARWLVNGLKERHGTKCKYSIHSRDFRLYPRY